MILVSAHISTNNCKKESTLEGTIISKDVRSLKMEAHISRKDCKKESRLEGTIISKDVRSLKMEGKLKERIIR